MERRSLGILLASFSHEIPHRKKQYLTHSWIAGSGVCALVLQLTQIGDPEAVTLRRWMSTNSEISLSLFFEQGLSHGESRKAVSSRGLTRPGFVAQRITRFCPPLIALVLWFWTVQDKYLEKGESDGYSHAWRSAERRVGKSVDHGGRRIIKKKKHNFILLLHFHLEQFV